MPQLDAETKNQMISHIKNDVEMYPATKQAIVEACNNMSEFSKEHKAWFEKTLPSKTYKNAHEVLKALKWA